MFRVIDLQQGSDEWKKWRRSCITATMPAVIMGKSPFMTPNQLWRSICLGEEKPFYSQAAEWGKIHEEPARIYAEKLLGCTIDKGPCIESINSYSFKAAASLDGCIGLRGSEDTGWQCDAIVEIKCPGEANFEAFKNGPPDHYILQMQWQMMVAACSSCHFICFRDFQVYSHMITLDPNLIEEMANAAEKFQKYIDDFEEPPLIDADFPKSDNPEAIALAKRYLECDEIEKAAKLEKDEIRKSLQIQADLVGYQRMIFGELKYSRYQTVRSNYDMEAIASDTGIDLDKYKITTSSCQTRLTKVSENEKA